MKDRDIALGYAEVKNDELLKNRYKDGYKRMAEVVKDNIGAVIALNGRFGINSMLKQYLKCYHYDAVVLNGTHQKYFFNVCKEDLEVDGFYTYRPDIAAYDTVLVDSSDISEEEYVSLINQVNDEQNLITIYDGVLAFSPPDGNGNHIPVFELDLFLIRGQRENDFIMDEFSPETEELLEKGLEDAKNGNLTEGPDLESDLGDGDEE